MSRMFQDMNGNPVPAFRYGTTQKVSYGAASAAIANAVDDDHDRLVLVWASTDCHIALGTNPTATTDDKPVTAKVDTPVVVRPGEKIAAIQVELGGDLYVTELL